MCMCVSGCVQSKQLYVEWNWFVKCYGTTKSKHKDQQWCVRALPALRPRLAATELTHHHPAGESAYTHSAPPFTAAPQGSGERFEPSQHPPTVSAESRHRQENKQAEPNSCPEGQKSRLVWLADNQQGRFFTFCRPERRSSRTEAAV